MQHLSVFKKKQTPNIEKNQILRKSSGLKHTSPENQLESQFMVFFLFVAFNCMKKKLWMLGEFGDKKGTFWLNLQNNLFSENI